jgi:hypothetical protein
VTLHSGGNNRGALRQTLLGDLVWEAATPRYRSVTEEGYELYAEFCSTKGPEVGNTHIVTLPTLLSSHFSTERFSITTEGYIGIGSPTLRVGDDVFVFKGNNILFVLRDQDKSVICHD